MTKNHFTVQDEKFINECIELSLNSIKNGDAPFGSIVVKDDEIISGVMNNASNRISDHAEVLALHEAHQKLNSRDLSGCSLYTNCEPCPMCSFMIREYRISKVVFAIPSPFMGGYSKWNILEDDELTNFADFFSKPPVVIGGVLEEEALKVFEDTPLWMFGSKAKKRLEK